MNGQLNLCVVIPVHKPQPLPDEVISLKAAYARLSSYSCYLVFPEGMVVSGYTEVFPGLQLKPINPGWLSSVELYNKLKLSPEFYQLFCNYHYMLTYELDAYIFHTDFESIGALDFDFIGAPFFEGYWAAVPGAKLMPGCNSGFSIRNISACTNVLQSMGKLRFKWWVYKAIFSHSSKFSKWLNHLTHKKYDLYLSGKFAFHFADFHLNEDVVWTEIVPRLFPDFKVADPISALKFSFEYNLEDSLQLNGDKLPLGCHAWYRHRDFWASYIDTEIKPDD